MMVELFTRKREIGIKMRAIRRIQEDMRNQGCDLPDCVGKASYRCYYTPEQNSSLTYRRWYIDLVIEFS